MAAATDTRTEMEETPASGVADTADETEARSKRTPALSGTKAGNPHVTGHSPVVGTALKRGVIAPPRPPLPTSHCGSNTLYADCTSALTTDTQSYKIGTQKLLPPFPVAVVETFHNANSAIKFLGDRGRCRCLLGLSGKKVKSE